MRIQKLIGQLMTTPHIFGPFDLPTSAQQEVFQPTATVALLLGSPASLQDKFFLTCLHKEDGTWNVQTYLQGFHMKVRLLDDANGKQHQGMTRGVCIWACRNHAEPRPHSTGPKAWLYGLFCCLGNAKNRTENSLTAIEGQG